MRRDNGARTAANGVSVSETALLSVLTTHLAFGDAQTDAMVDPQ
jgi:hypothetical protein